MHPKLLNTLRTLCGYQMPKMGRLLAGPLIKNLPETLNCELFPHIHCTLNPKDSTQQSTYWLGRRFEADTQRALKSYLRQGATHFFDIGSNYGFFSYLLYTDFPGVEIYSFEPNPKTFSLLAEIVSKNRLTRIHPQNLGLSHTEEVLTFYQTTEDSGHSSFGKDPNIEQFTETTAPTIPFDTWCSRNGLSYPREPKWVAKIDVEGFEPNVLTGMTHALAAKAFIGISIEVFPPNLEYCGFSAKDIYEALGDAGYFPNIPLTEVNSKLAHNVEFTPERN
jgi:FkbM family methyltransferase